MTTIFFRILKSFILIILLTVLLSTAIEFFSTKEELPQLLTEVRTKNIAQYLGASYTRERGWENLSDEIMWLEQENINKSTIPSMRIIVRDSDGKTLYNSFTQLSISSDFPLIEGRSIPILNLRTGKTAGTITAYIDKNYLEVETVDYLISLLIPRLLQGVITFFIAFIAAFFLSRRITKPITALTKAAEVISLKENTPILPIESKDELGRMSESFNRMVRSLEHQQKLRKRLIGDVSHEILTPLNLIRLEARGLLDEITTPAQGAPKIIEEVDQMKNLIQDLDWLAETDSGEYHLKKEMVSLSPLIQKEVESWYLKGEAEDKEIILMDLPSGLPLINIDPLRFSQALGNLIENAIKYSYPESAIRINCYMEESSAVISVQDQSTGIASKDKANLFERFYQADTPRTSNNSGRGLGLAIVQQIMELHNGKVWFTSKQNEGSTFFISLPLKS